jgi:hypothetical protein
MSNSVEIFQNTLLKLVVRSGSDSDRKAIVLDVGEIGYTTDTKRLYVGDGVTLGGVLAGNVVIGQAADFSAIAATPPAIGDLVYVTGSSTLYRYISGVSTLSTSWSPVGRIYSPENTTIVFTGSGNQVKVGTLSANNFSNDAVGRNIIIDSGRIALSANIALDSVKPLNNTFVALPSSLKIGLSTYNFPITGSQPVDSFLRSDGNGNLTWSNAATLLATASAFALSATLVAGKGINLSVGGVQRTEAKLLTSGNITIDTVFAPTQFIEFNQSGVITRQTGGIAVAGISYSTLKALGNTPDLGDRNTFNKTTDPSKVQTRFDAPASGAWKITGITNVDPLSSVVDVTVKNASYKHPLIDRRVVTPDLSSRYFFKANTLVPGTYDLYVYTYVSGIIITDSGRDLTTPTDNSKALTPGYSDPSTRFSVTVYA